VKVLLLWIPYGRFIGQLYYLYSIHRQLHLIWDATSIYLKEALQSGRGVNIPHFGALTFEPTPQVSNLELRPCFIPNPELALLIKDRKEQLNVSVEGSIYQQGIRMSYFNSVPIASACFLPAQYVKHAIGLVFRAINDLIFRDYSLIITFSSLLTIRIINRKLTTTFHSDLKTSTTNIAKCWPLKSVNNSLPATLHLGGQKQGTCEIVSPVRALIDYKPETKLSKLQTPDASSLHDMKTRIRKLNESSKDLSNIAPHD